VLSDDVVWLDEDGHAVTPKNRVVGSFLQGQLSGQSMRTITPRDIRTGMTDDAAWASFAYTLDTDGAKKQGLATMVFKKNGNDWQIVLVHAAANHPVTHTPLP
jgi:ketosteroid isomerase-like protein